MATVYRASGPSAALAYISTQAFPTYFFSYSTSINPSLETVGSLTQVVSATAFTCPAGRVLRENGRRLFPGANPGVTTYMVGVYDAQSLLSGFIDPNAKVFQIYNTDKPSFLSDGVDPTTSTTDLGPSVYTRGGIYAQGAMDISGSAHIYGNMDIGGAVDISGSAFIYGYTGVVGSVDISGGLTVYGGETVKTGDLVVSAGRMRSSNIVNLGTGSAFTVDCSLGQVFKFTTNANATITASNLAAGQVIYVIVQGDVGGRSIDFNAPFQSVNVGVRTINASLCTFSFVSDGVSLFQIAEAIGLSP